MEWAQPSWTWLWGWFQTTHSRKRLFFIYKFTNVTIVSSPVEPARCLPIFDHIDLSRVMKSLNLPPEAKYSYNLRLYLHIFSEISALFCCNTWFRRDTVRAPIALSWKLAPVTSRQSPVSGLDRFNKVFQSEESIDQLVAFLLLIRRLNCEKESE